MQDASPAQEQVFVGKNAFRNIFALKAMALVAGSLERACVDGSDARERSDMLLGALAAGCACNSLSFVTWKDRKTVTPDLKAIYRAESAELALRRLEAFEAKWASRYPAIGPSWRRAWGPGDPALRLSAGKSEWNPLRPLQCCPQSMTRSSETDEHGGEHQLEHRFLAEGVGNDLQAPALLGERALEQVRGPDRPAVSDRLLRCAMQASKSSMKQASALGRFGLIVGDHAFGELVRSAGP